MRVLVRSAACPLFALLVFSTLSCSNGGSANEGRAPAKANRGSEPDVKSIVDEKKLPPAVETLAQVDVDLLWNVVSGVMSEYGYRENDRATGTMTSNLFGWTDSTRGTKLYGSLAVRLAEQPPGSKVFKVAVWCYRFERRDEQNRPVLDGEDGTWVMTGLHLDRQERIATAIREQYLTHTRGGDFDGRTPAGR